MKTITTNNYISSDLEAIEIASSKSDIKPCQTVNVVDNSGTAFIVKKPYCKYYRIQPKEENYSQLSKWWRAGKANYSQLSDDNIASLVYIVDFELWCIENKFKKRYFVRDMQGVNLGGVGSEVFKTLQEVAERLETYYDDYL